MAMVRPRSAGLQEDPGLLGFLIATGQPHRRERLCDLFWDGPDDPRAELRWCLSKIRPLLGNGARLVADRQRVAIELGNAASISRPCGRCFAMAWLAASTEAWSNPPLCSRGEFLDGLELPACYRYQEWCMAERETISQLRLGCLPPD